MIFQRSSKEKAARCCCPCYPEKNGINDLVSVKRESCTGEYDPCGERYRHGGTEMGFGGDGFGGGSEATCVPAEVVNDDASQLIAMSGVSGQNCDGGLETAGPHLVRLENGELGLMAKGPQKNPERSAKGRNFHSRRCMSASKALSRQYPQTM